MGDTTSVVRIKRASLLLGGFVEIPKNILPITSVTVGAKVCLSVMLSYVWHKEGEFPGQRKLAQDMGVSLRSAVNYIRELEKRKLLSIKRKGRGRTSIYTLHV